jgi:hypothetical protein
MPRPAIARKNLIQLKDSLMKLHFYFMLLIGVLICSPKAANAKDSDNTLVATAAAVSTIDRSPSNTSNHNGIFSVRFPF